MKISITVNRIENRVTYNNCLVFIYYEVQFTKETPDKEIIDFGGYGGDFFFFFEFLNLK